MYHRILFPIFILSQFTGTTQNIIPNYSFEFWENSEPQDWFTSNITDDSIYNIFQVSPGYSGLSAIGGRVMANPEATDIPLAPILESNTSDFGFDIDKEYSFLSFYYTFSPQSVNDYLSISISILDGQGSVYGSGLGIISSAQSEFTPFDIPIEYLEGDPSKAVISITVGNSGPALIPTVGTFFVLDELTLNDQTTSLSEPSDLLSGIIITPLYPDLLAISFSSTNPIDYHITLINILGQECAQLKQGKASVGFNKLTLSLPPHIPGLYYCRVQSANAQVSKPVYLN